VGRSSATKEQGRRRQPWGKEEDTVREVLGVGISVATYNRLEQRDATEWIRKRGVGRYFRKGFPSFLTKTSVFIQFLGLGFNRLEWANPKHFSDYALHFSDYNQRTKLIIKYWISALFTSVWFISHR
jgi:hypothetical protein